MPNWKKVITSGSNAELNSLNVSTSFTSSGLIYPTVDGDNGDFLSTNGAGNLTFQRSTIYANVKNVSGGTLPKGTPIHATGTAGNASEVIAASASVASAMPATYVLNETLADDAEGLAIITGYINGINTSAFSEGDIVYVGESGGYTNNKPSGSINLIQNLGIVNKVDASNGSGYIYGSGRSNDVPNLPTGKIWVGNDYTVTSSIVTLDEPNSQAEITGSLVVTSAVTASSYTGSFVGDGSGILNVVSSSYAVTSSHALNAGGTDTVVVQYGHTSGNALGDSADYFIGMGTTMGNTGNSSIQIGIQAGTLVRADIATYNASTFGSSEASTVSVFSNNFAQENTISTSVLFNARHSLVSVTGLSISLAAGLSAIKLLTPAFTTNPASAKINITLYIEI
jgi:hypothetical protein